MRSWAKDAAFCVEELLLSANLGDDDFESYVEALYEAVIAEPKEFAEELRQILYAWRLERGRCPECGGDLEERSWYEPRPYGSTVAYERLSEPWCRKCGPV